MQQVFLGIGEVYASRTPTTVTTVLGSCVSVTMFSPRYGFGAICHAALPEGDPGGFKYVDFSIRWMIKWFERHFISTNEFEVKLFGGGNMFESMEMPSQFLAVGRLNTEKALEVITAEGLRLVGSSVGGRVGRRITYLTHTGEVTVKTNPALLRERSAKELAVWLEPGPAGEK